MAPENQHDRAAGNREAYTAALKLLDVHRRARPVLLELGDPLTHIAKVIDWRIEMETIVDGILERAGY